MDLVGLHVYLREHPLVDPDFVGVKLIVKYVEVLEDDTTYLTVRRAGEGVSPRWGESDRYGSYVRVSKEEGPYRNVPIEALKEFAMSYKPVNYNNRVAYENFQPYVRHRVGRYTDGRSFVSVYAH